MKTKKLVLNKETIADLARNHMDAARGGIRTVYSCRITIVCLTYATCDSAGPGCECTDLCTFTC